MTDKLDYDDVKAVHDIGLIGYIDNRLRCLLNTLEDPFQIYWTAPALKELIELRNQVDVSHRIVTASPQESGEVTEPKQPQPGEFWVNKDAMEGNGRRLILGKTTDGRFVYESDLGRVGATTLEAVMDHWYHASELTSFDDYPGEKPAKSQDDEQPQPGEFWRTLSDEFLVLIIGYSYYSSVVYETPNDGLCCRPLREFIRYYKHAPEATSFDG